MYSVGDIVKWPGNSSKYRVLRIVTSRTFDIESIEGSDKGQRYIGHYHGNAAQVISSAAATSQQHAGIQAQSMGSLASKPKYCIGDTFTTPSNYVWTLTNVYTMPDGSTAYSMSCPTLGVTPTPVPEKDVDEAISKRSWKYQPTNTGTVANPHYLAQAGAGIKKPVVSAKAADCHIVEATAGGKEYLYCRAHDDEADHKNHCRKAQ
jgi:hypothetical protein